VTNVGGDTGGSARLLWQSDPMIFSVVVEVQLRPGIADPQGSTIERSLPALGFGGVRDVRVGKSMRFTLEAADEASARAEVADMCERFLTNPVIEDAVITVTEGVLA
jgi:phosphoribosylformylglycinamidine synthase PurS subunit